jgi:hypothetical protein
MAEARKQPATDPLTMWRDWAQQLEDQWNQYFNQAMGTDAFAAMMGRSMETMLAFQSSLAEQFEATLKAWNLPSRADITAVTERLAAIEERLDRLAKAAERDRPAPRSKQTAG